MQVIGARGKAILFVGCILGLGQFLEASVADAAAHRGGRSGGWGTAHVGQRSTLAYVRAPYGHSHSGYRRFARGRHYRYAYYGGVQCVPFARLASGVEIVGNANTWWEQAAGVYERGSRPEMGSVLSFTANGRMRLGHVAVVSNVINAREIEIDHANWWGPGGGRGRISRNIAVVDVSERNDWTAVRVALGNSGEFGSIYPTHGFIYDRADKGMMVAAGPAMPAPELNPPPADLRARAERVYVGRSAPARGYDEVAEAPIAPRRGRGLDLRVAGSLEASFQPEPRWTE